MSRNIGQSTCPHCGDTPVIKELPHPITEQEAHRYYEGYKGMIVARAECPSCCAVYLAWIDESQCTRPVYPRGTHPFDGRFVDLSYYSTFNDEPGEADGPMYKILVTTLRVRVGRNHD